MSEQQQASCVKTTAGKVLYIYEIACIMTLAAQVTLKSRAWNVKVMDENCVVVTLCSTDIDAQCRSFCCMAAPVAFSRVVFKDYRASPTIYFCMDKQRGFEEILRLLLYTCYSTFTFRTINQPGNWPKQTLEGRWNYINIKHTHLCRMLLAEMLLAEIFWLCIRYEALFLKLRKACICGHFYNVLNSWRLTRTSPK